LTFLNSASINSIGTAAANAVWRTIRCTVPMSCHEEL
jgi:hypothetical protein